MTLDELYQKKITEHCNMYDIVLCQRFFRFIIYMQERIFEREKDFRIVAQSLIPANRKEDIIPYFTMFLKDRTKAEEVYELLEYKMFDSGCACKLVSGCETELAKN